MPAYDVIGYFFGSWTVGTRKSPPKSDKVYTRDNVQNWTEVEADNPKDAMVLGYERIMEAIKNKTIQEVKS